MKWLLSSLLVGLVIFLNVNTAFAHVVPDYDGIVNDYANIISDTTEAELESQLGALATSTDGAELAVVTINSLEGNAIEHYAQEYFDEWKIGKANKDNGVLLLVAVEDREMRIQTGYGTEVVLTDSTAGSIIRNDIAPSFKAGDYDQGIKQGVNRIVSYLQDPTQIPDTADSFSPSSNDDFDPTWVLVAIYVVFTLGVSGITYLAAFLGRSKEWWPGGLIGLILGGLVGHIPGGIAFGLFGLFLDYLLSTNFKNWNIEQKTTDWRSTWGGFHSGSSSSSSSSSGFSSFGGGRSGGGGASGGW